MAPSDDDVRAQLDRICGSPGFERSPRLRRFLRYLVEESRAGRADRLKEYAIGVEVFERGASFDPRLDPIVRVEARRLRGKLAGYYDGPGAGDPVRIDVPTGGYEAVVSEGPALAAAVARPPAEAAPPPAPPRTRAGRLALAGVGLAAVAALAWGLSRGRAPGERTQPARAPVSVAVLPLAPIGPDPSVAEFSDGLTEDIITQLARVRGLRVIARTSVNRFKETRTPIRTIASDLGVDAVLEGSVRREQGRLRITAQLVDGRDERHLWAESYDRTYVDTLAIQGEVAREVTAALALRLTADEQRRLGRSGTASGAAHEAYLRGVHHMTLRNPAEVQKGLAWLQKAVELDPAFGAARATLGETYLFLALEGAGPPAGLLDKTHQLARAALAADPDLPEGHRALGLVHAFLDRDFAAAERELRTALELAPGLLGTQEALATTVLLPLGRLPEAIDQQRAAVAGSPLSAPAIAMLGRMTEMAGDEAEGVRLLKSAIDLEPRYARAYIQLAKLHLSHGRAAEALPLLRTAQELAPQATSGLGALAVAQAALGRRSEAEAIGRALTARAAQGWAPTFPRAEVAMALGDREAAFALFERAAAEHEPWVVYLSVDPIYEPLRADPRFDALVRRLGLGVTVTTSSR